MKITNFKIATKDKPKTKQAFIFKHRNIDFAIIKEKNFYNISHFATGLDVKSTLETSENKAMQYFINWCCEELIKRMEASLEQNKYPIFNDIETIKPYKEPKKREKPTLQICEGLSIKTIEYSKTFEFDGEKYALAKTRLDYEIYHFATGKCAQSSGESTIDKTIEKFKNRLNSFDENIKNRYRDNLKNHLKINNI
jgi:hypothetical protein